MNDAELVAESVERGRGVVGRVQEPIGHSGDRQRPCKPRAGPVETPGQRRRGVAYPPQHARPGPAAGREGGRFDQQAEVRKSPFDMLQPGIAPVLQIELDGAIERGRLPGGEPVVVLKADEAARNALPRQLAREAAKLRLAGGEIESVRRQLVVSEHQREPADQAPEPRLEHRSPLLAVDRTLRRTLGSVRYPREDWNTP